MSETKTKKVNRVDVYVPRNGNSSDPNVIVSVNGVNYLLPRGKKSSVPDFVALEYYRGVAAENALYAHKEKMIEQAQDPIVQR